MKEINVSIMKTKAVIKVVIFFILLSGYTSLMAQQAIQIDKVNRKLVAPVSSQIQWYKNGQLLSGQNTRELLVNETAEYMVALTDDYGKTRQLNIVVEVNANGIRRIFVIGDSTASVYSASNYPRTGWAQVLQPFFNIDSILVVDKALSGRSSKSFYTDANGWPVVLKDLSAGDFLFIQFGHNDQKSDDPDRYTEPFTTFKEYLSIYIDTALARGAYPVLLTSIHRNKWSGSTINDSHGDYPTAMKELATGKNIPLIDLHAKSRELFEAFGETYVTNNFFMNLPENQYPGYLSGNSDNTHLQEEGAYRICEKVLEAIDEQKNANSLALIAPLAQEAVFIKPVVNPFLTGTVAGAGVVTKGKDMEMTAKNSSGYAFVGWFDASGFLSGEPVYTLNTDTNRFDLYAKFDTGYKISVSKSPYSGGTVSGAGTYLLDKELIITATPKEGYNFVHWKKGDEIVSTDTAYNIAVVGDETYVAVFEEVTGQRQVQKSGSIQVYPNPASNLLHIISAQKMVSVELMDVTGKSIYYSSIDGDETILDISGLSKGLKIVNIKTEKGALQKTVVLK